MSVSCPDCGKLNMSLKEGSCSFLDGSNVPRFAFTASIRCETCFRSTYATGDSATEALNNARKEFFREAKTLNND